MTSIPSDLHDLRATARQDTAPALGSAHGWRRRARDGGVVVAVALGFGALEAMQGRVLYRDVPWNQFWPEALIRTIPCWLTLAALVPPMVWMSRRARVTGANWAITLPVQMAAGAAFVFAHLASSALLIEALRRRPDVSATDVFVGMFSRYAVMDFFTYCGIVAAIHAIDYQSEARERRLAASQLEASLTRARLETLRAQLDPHFLFNALNSISVLALQGNAQGVVQTVSCLGDVLRMSLDERGAQEIPLAAELELLDRYLELERVRFGDRLAVERRIDPDTLAARVPSLMLQPLVENAVRHSVGARRGPGRIVIESRRENGMLRVEVRDSGADFPPALREGIGLGNTRARLKQLHGDAQRMEIGAAEEGGGRVTVVLPFRGAPDAEEPPA